MVSSSRRKVLVGIAFALAWAPASVAAAPSSLEAELSLFLGNAAGTLESHPTLAYSNPSPTLLPFAIPAGVFTASRTDPVATHLGGPVPLPPPNLLIALSQNLQQSNLAGSFGPGLAPGGGFGGVLDLGLELRALFGISPLPNVFGSIVMPVPVGTTGTQTAMGGITGNTLHMMATGQAWTTGTIQFGSGFLTPGSAQGSVQMGKSIGAHPTRSAIGSTALDVTTITLVTPISFVQSANGLPIAQRAGYASLSLTRRSVPEPTSVFLLGVSVLALLGLGNRLAG
jgi:hypothetical protein